VIKPLPSFPTRSPRPVWSSKWPISQYLRATHHTLWFRYRRASRATCDLAEPKASCTNRHAQGHDRIYSRGEECQLSDGARHDHKKQSDDPLHDIACSHTPAVRSFLSRYRTRPRRAVRVLAARTEYEAKSIYGRQRRIPGRLPVASKAEPRSLLNDRHAAFPNPRTQPISAA